MLIGELLVSLGLITQEQLERSLALQARQGGRLGQVIAGQGYCAQERIDRAWGEAVVVPALRQAVDRALGGGAERMQARFRIAHLARRTLTQEDLLNGCAEMEVALGIEGVAEMSFEGVSWVPFQFIFLSSSNMAYLDLESAQAIQGWATEFDRARVGAGARAAV